MAKKNARISKKNSRTEALKENRRLLSALESLSRDKESRITKKLFVAMVSASPRFDNFSPDDCAYILGVSQEEARSIYHELFVDPSTKIDSMDAAVRLLSGNY